MDAQRITIAYSDASGGFDTTAQRVLLASLREFVGDVDIFLRGDAREIDTDSLEVAVRSGSLAIQTIPIAMAPTLFRDLRSMLDSFLLDSIDARRKAVVERWQKQARSNLGISVRIEAAFLPRPVVINSSSDYHANDADQWVHVERYVRGEVQDLGGSTRANAHVRLPDGKLLTVGTNRELLRSDKTNRLYKPALLRVRARYNVLTQELRDAELIEFVEYAPKFDEQAFERLTQRGAEAWKDVGDASQWIDDLRGEDE
jgi:hypothetical protein